MSVWVRCMTLSLLQTQHTKHHAFDGGAMGRVQNDCREDLLAAKRAGRD